MGLTLLYLSYRYNLLFVIQPKTDTKGQACTLALQHLMAGVYIAELALVGLFGLASAIGPLVMVAVLLLVTITYNYLMNKYLKPLENNLPANLAFGQLERDEATPLLASAEEGLFSSLPSSDAHRLFTRISQVFGPVARFFEPREFASLKATESWLREDAADYEVWAEETSRDSEEQLSKAYQNPALTSSTSVVWIPRDEAGASKSEVAETEKVGLKATDHGAWLDRKRKLRWNQEDLRDIPLASSGSRS